jgi:5-formyltetrahydrofolate cyclo-ligase
MTTEKSVIRAYFKEWRNQLSGIELQEASQKIAALVEEFCDCHMHIDHFHIFFPIKRLREIDTYLIRAILESRNKVIYTARLNPISTEMETVLIEKQTEFEPDRYGIPVPKILKLVSPKSLQVVFTPLLGVDMFGNRIGYGKGHYDRFFEKLDHKVLKIGLSVFEPIKMIPKESFDIPLDYCITPKNIFSFSK